MGQWPTTTYFFYQHAFIEAIGVAVSTIAQASAIGGQGGSSNL